jgi:hypothetical protein
MLNFVFFLAHYRSDPQWLGHTKGEVLTFDGVTRFRNYYGGSELLPSLRPLLIVFCQQVRDMMFTLLKMRRDRKAVSVQYPRVRFWLTVLFSP